jgi:hypothetical protein
MPKFYRFDASMAEKIAKARSIVGGFCSQDDMMG